jgi:hypothetical protein
MEWPTRLPFRGKARDMGGFFAQPPQSIFAPVAFTTRAHFGISVLM